MRTLPAVRVIFPVRAVRPRSADGPRLDELRRQHRLVADDGRPGRVPLKLNEIVVAGLRIEVGDACARALLGDFARDGSGSATSRLPPRLGLVCRRRLFGRSLVCSWFWRFLGLGRCTFGWLIGRRVLLCFGCLSSLLGLLSSCLLP